MGKMEYMRRAADELQALVKNNKYVNITNTASYLGVSRSKAKIILNGKPFLPNGREKLYHVNDVASAILNNCSRF